MSNIFYRVLSPLFQDEITKAVHDQFSVWVENDTTFYESGNLNQRDRLEPDRRQILEDVLLAWQTNPLARRIVSLTTQYVVGGGINFTSKHEPTLKFMREFWNHPINAMPRQIYEWCDELTRTGNLFLLLSCDSVGMTYVRAIPTSLIDEIQAKSNDVEHPIKFVLSDQDKTSYPAFDFQDPPAVMSSTVMQFTINKPVGAQWGESDLAPSLKWLSRYSNWLEDRARLNRYRTAFLYIVTGVFKSDAERIARQNQLNAQPPNPGSIIVVNENEKWEAVSAKLESNQAGEDGLAIKKMIAAGSGIPMHFLAEPESSTRTTAEAAGGPTYRHFEQRQILFSWIIKTLFKAAISNRSSVDKSVLPSAEIEISGSDISSRDNISLAMATSNIAAALSEVRDRELIDDHEFLRLLYRFCGETMDVEEMLKRGAKAGPSKLPPDYNRRSQSPVNSLRKSPVNIDTGEDKRRNTDA